MIEAVLKYLNGIKPLAPDLEAHIRAILKERDVKKNALVLKEGGICGEIFFVGEGMFVGRQWQGVEEVTSWIMREGNIVISPWSYFEQKASKEWIIAVENAKVCGLTRKQVYDIYEQWPEFNLHGRVITERYYMLQLDKQENFVRLTGLEKYEFLLKHDPELVRRCPQKYLASYLGVSETTLSSIKSQVMEAK